MDFKDHETIEKFGNQSHRSYKQLLIVSLPLWYHSWTELEISFDDDVERVALFTRFPPFLISRDGREDRRVPLGAHVFASGDLLVEAFTTMRTRAP